jgi:hypothetical protein
MIMMRMKTSRWRAPTAMGARSRGGPRAGISGGSRSCTSSANAHDLTAIARVVSMASETGTALRLERYDDGWRWGVVARGGVEQVEAAAAAFTGVDGRLTSDDFHFTEIEDGWWVLHPSPVPIEAPEPEATAVVEPDRPIDIEEAALLVRELFAL